MCTSSASSLRWRRCAALVLGQGLGVGTSGPRNGRRKVSSLGIPTNGPCIGRRSPGQFLGQFADPLLCTNPDSADLELGVRVVGRRWTAVEEPGRQVQCWR